MTNGLTKYASDWFARGDDDLALVKLILDQRTGSANLACFHAQQVAEKYLKGFLAYRDLHVRKIHDLETLLEDCKIVDADFMQLQDDVRLLNRFYAESRYPDDYVECSRQDAEAAYAAALRIKEFALSKVRPSETNGGFGLLGIIIALAVVVLAAGGGLYYRNRQLTTNNQQQTTNDDSVAVNESSVDTSNWKTYRNEKYGFEFKYPNSYDNNSNTHIGGPQSAEHLGSWVDPLTEIGWDSSVDGFAVYVDSSRSLRDYFNVQKQIMRGYYEEIYGGGAEFYDISVEVGGKMGLILSEARNPSFSLIFIPLSDDKILIISKSEHEYAKGSFDMVFEKIISMFKFTK